MPDIITEITAQFNGKIRIEEKRPGIMQLYVPIFHEDGDMIDLFLNVKEQKLLDYGQTLMRLSYTYDIDTENKEAILQKILTENQVNDQEGNLWITTKPETVFTDVMHMTSVLSKVGSMRYFKREVIESLFYEILDEFITAELQEFMPIRRVYPIPERDDIEADYQFSPNGHPVYLFGVKDANKAKLATITCLELQRAKINFRGWVVNEDFEKLPKKDRSRLTNTCDKQFTSLDQFKLNAKDFLKREKSA
jgi:hypothetical protein